MILGDIERVRGLECFNALGCVHPHAIHDGLIKLFYTPYPPDSEELPYLSVSKDGLHFKTACPHPLLTRGTWDSHHLADIDILRGKGDRWYMYYAGASLEGGKKRVSIGVAEGDGRCKWKKLGIVVKGDPIATTPSGLNLDGDYLLYFSVNRDGKYILMGAESEDGIHFKGVREVLGPLSTWNKQGINHPHASIHGNKIILLFLGFDGSCYSLGYALFERDDPFKPVRIKGPLLSNRSSIFCKLNRTKMYRVLSEKLKYIYSKVKERHHDEPKTREIFLPFWRGLHYYRSSLLTTPTREVVTFNGNRTLLYVSAYDGLLKIPSIGVTEAILDD